MNALETRSVELRRKLEELYAQGDHFDYGSLVYEYPGSNEAQNEVLQILKLHFPADLDAFSLGFHMGNASFMDCIIGKTRCHQDTSDRLGEQRCIYVLFCNYTNIYVIGEHTYFERGGYRLPCFLSVDNFHSDITRELADEVSILLKTSSYRRAFATELDGALPKRISTKSNLAGNSQLIFDGYFNWTD